MSKAAFKRAFTTPLLNRLESQTRKKIEKISGQLLVLDNIAAFHQIMLLTFGIDVDNTRAASAYTAGTKKALQLQKAFAKKHPNRYKTAVRRAPTIPTINHLVLGKNLFIVSTFRDSMDAVKKAIWADLVNTKVLTQAQSNRISSDGSLHKGHGVDGLAVSQVQTASSVAMLVTKADKDLLISNLDSFFQVGKINVIRQHRIKELFTTWNQQVTTRGKLRADYFSIITFQIGDDNIRDKNLEQGLKTTYRNFVKSITPKLLNLQGSSTLKEKIEAEIVRAATPKMGEVVVKTKTRGTKLKTKGSSRLTNPDNKATATLKRAGTARAGRKRHGSDASLVSIMADINAKLHDVIKKKMVLPALVYRSGTFARSVEVGTPTKTAGGFTNIPYRYDFSPYSVFDFAHGTEPWNTKDRDPDVLIDQSIREIVAGRLGARFYTRKTFLSLG